MSAFMNFVANCWCELVFTVALVVVLVIDFIAFSRQATDKKIAQVKGWLLGAVIEAEKVLGGGTGKLKLSYVYDKFIERFPWIAKFLTFEDFSRYVDEVLVEMKTILSSNAAISNIVKGDK